MVRRHHPPAHLTEATDVPHFSDDTSLDSHDVARGLKGRLNSSLTDVHENRGGNAAAAAAGGGGGGDDASSHSSNRSHRGGSRGGGLREDQVDLPHLDDVLKASRDADAAGGGGGAPAKSAIFVEDEESAVASPVASRGALRDALRSGRSNPEVGGGDDDAPPPPERTYRAKGYRRRSSAESGSSGGVTGAVRRASGVFESLWGNYRDDDDDDEPDASEGYGVGGGGGDGDGDGGGAGSSARLYDDAGSTTSDGSLRGFFGRSGFFKAGSGGGGGATWRGADPPRRYHGGRGGSCCRRVRSRAGRTFVCVATCVAVAATVGALVVMVPLWLGGNEREESGELGGLAYGGGEGGMELTGEAAGGGGGEDGGYRPPPGTDEEKGIEGPAPSSEGQSASSSSSSSTTTAGPKPPPYDLQLLCRPSAILSPEGYRKCLGACAPSRCCLVPEGSPYEVWKEEASPTTTTTTSGGGAGMMQAISGTSAEEVKIGTLISSCFQASPDTCVKYYNQCSVLGTDALLPRKPPTNEDVQSMSDRQKLELAEWVNHSCARIRKGDTAECRSLCDERECCFVDLPDRAPAKKPLEHPAVAAANGGGKFGTVQDDTLLANGFVELEKFKDFDDDGLGLKDQPETYHWDAGVAASSAERGGAPSPEPTRLDQFFLGLTPYPTAAHESHAVGATHVAVGGSYPPTDEFLADDDLSHSSPGGRRLRRERDLADGGDDDPNLVHLSIPGEEDFVYVMEGEGDGRFFGQGAGGVGSVYPGSAGTSEYPESEEEEESEAEVVANAHLVDRGEPVKVQTYAELVAKEEALAAAKERGSCAGDPAMSCATFAGCAPLFGK